MDLVSHSQEAELVFEVAKPNTHHVVRASDAWHSPSLFIVDILSSSYARPVHLFFSRDELLEVAG
jgi:hypothetical protein